MNTSSGQADHLQRWHLTERQLFDLECLLTGCLEPLTGFLDENDYQSVCENMRLANGEVWPIPFILDITQEFADSIEIGKTILLVDKYNSPLATLEVQSLWRPDLEFEVEAVYGTSNPEHPGVEYILERNNRVYCGGSVEQIQLPPHFDYSEYRLKPSQVKAAFEKSGVKKVVGMQTRNALHSAHLELMIRAQDELRAGIFLNPVVGPTMRSDTNYLTRIRTYEASKHILNNRSFFFSLLPLAMRMAGPREAVLHAIIRKNFGCTHFIIGRDHSGPGLMTSGQPFYDAQAAANLAGQFQEEIGITIVPYSEIGVSRRTGLPVLVRGPKDDLEILNISGSNLRDRVQNNEPIPSWLTPHEIAVALKHAARCKNRGLVILLTGLPGSGKSSIAETLAAHLRSSMGTPIILLDGDHVRQTICADLGYSEADRNENLKRVAELASEYSTEGCIVICSLIAPFAAGRESFRDLVREHGDYLEVYVSTPLNICEERDPKGLYALARSGELGHMTGISSPYEQPLSPDVNHDTSNFTLAQSVDQILQAIKTNLSRFHVKETDANACFTHLDNGSIDTHQLKYSKQKIDHLVRSIDYIEGRIEKVNADCRVFVLWLILSVGLFAGAHSYMQSQLGGADQLVRDIAIRFPYIWHIKGIVNSVLLIMIMWSVFNVLLFVYCIRPVSDVPNLNQVLSLKWFWDSLFKRRAMGGNSARVFSFMWPAGRKAPRNQEEYLARISTLARHWEQETEVRELLSTLAALHLLIGRKMNWYSLAVLATRVQVFAVILLFGCGIFASS